MHEHAKSLQPCLTLCDPMDFSPPGFSIHEILQARILEWTVMSSSRGSSQLRNQTFISTAPKLASRFFITRATWNYIKVKSFFKVNRNNQHNEKVTYGMGKKYLQAIYMIRSKYPKHIWNS